MAGKANSGAPGPIFSVLLPFPGFGAAPFTGAPPPSFPIFYCCTYLTCRPGFGSPVSAARVPELAPPLRPATALIGRIGHLICQNRYRRGRHGAKYNGNRGAGRWCSRNIELVAQVRIIQPYNARRLVCRDQLGKKE